MKNALRTLIALTAGSLIASSSAWAHHGSSISYNTDYIWSTWATITEFNYMNPHPTLRFDRTTSDGEVEHWVAEMLTNPAMLARAGWTRSKTEDAMQVGKRVKLHLATSRAGGFSGIVMVVANEDGDEVAGNRGVRDDVPDLDGVPGGLQPEAGEYLPGMPTQ